MGEGPSNQQTPALWGLHGQFMVQHNLDTTNNNLWNITITVFIRLTALGAY